MEMGIPLQLKNFHKMNGFTFELKYWNQEPGFLLVIIRNRHWKYSIYIMELARAQLALIAPPMDQPFFRI